MRCPCIPYCLLVAVAWQVYMCSVITGYAGDMGLTADGSLSSALDSLSQRLPPLRSVEECRVSCSIASLPFPYDVDEEAVAQRVLRARVGEVLRHADSVSEAGDYAAAASALEALLPTVTNSSMRSLIFERLGACHFDMGEYPTALRFMEFAEYPLLSPAEVSHRCNLAAIHIAMGNPQKAKELLVSVVSDNSDGALQWAICFNMACALSLLGDKGGALSYLQRAYVADPLATRLHAGDIHLDNVRAEPPFESMISGHIEERRPALPLWQGLGVDSFNYSRREDDEETKKGRHP